jgi:hypothetical protein
VDFEVSAFRFQFQAIDSIYLPPGKAGNVFRGVLGESLRRVACRSDCPGAKICPLRRECVYARFFEPVLDSGPSGLADPPRPFVLRPELIAGSDLPPGSQFNLDVHVFDTGPAYLRHLIAAFSQLAESGLGPGRGRAELARVSSIDATGASGALVFESGRVVEDASPAPLRLPLDPLPADAVTRMRVRFVTPVELKLGGGVVDHPEFGVLMARVRDRIASLDRLYGSGKVGFDWDTMARAAAQVRTAESTLEWERTHRRSSRTGQSHPIGGLTGTVEYQGPLGGFVPLMSAGMWTGVGRQTVWGKGAYRIEIRQR